jgi:hypothetical protein
MELFRASGRVLALKGFGGVNLRYMGKVVLIIALPLLVLPGLAQSRNCLRVNPIDELTRQAILIARVKVHRVDKANYRGAFSQIAMLTPVDVIDGDFTLKEINVLARSSVRCAEDHYTRDDEMLVFLEPEGSLFQTVNFQYGQFPIVGEIVKGWRDKANNPIDKPYAEVRREIQACVNASHTPKLEGEQPQKPPPSVKPPEPRDRP